MNLFGFTIVRTVAYDSLRAHRSHLEELKSAHDHSRERLKEHLAQLETDLINQQAKYEQQSKDYFAALSRLDELKHANNRIAAISGCLVDENARMHQTLRALNLPTPVRSAKR